MRSRERALVLFHADWCPFSSAFIPLFEEAEPDAPVPCGRVLLRHPMDPRWDEHRILVVPTLAYFEHGEELERIEGVRGRGLTRRDLDEIFEMVENIQPEPVLPKRMHGLRRRR